MLLWRLPPPLRQPSHEYVSQWSYSFGFLPTTLNFKNCEVTMWGFTDINRSQSFRGPQLGPGLYESIGLEAQEPLSNGSLPAMPQTPDISSQEGLLCLPDTRRL